MNKIMFGYIFIGIGILVQIISYIWFGSDLLSMISGIAGVFSVVLCSQKKILMYFFGFIQLFTYMIIAMQHNFYGEFVENIFYALTMIGGIYLWKKHYKNNEVETKCMSKKNTLLVILGNVISIVILYIILKNTNDEQPFLDSLNTIPAFTAQILMIWRYREQWIFWIFIDIFTGIMWICADNACMVMQYIFWTLNCIYGYYLWSKAKI